MKLRMIGVLAALVAAAVGLTACQAKAGAAALVGGQRISEGTVNQYLTPQASPYQGQGGQVIPRSTVLQTLIRTQLITQAAAADRISITTGDINNAKAQLLQQSTEDQLTQEITKSGFAASFEPVYLQSQAVLTAFGNKIGAKSDADILKAIDKAHVPVSVSARYGPWQEKTLSLGTVSAPSFVRLSSSAPAASVG